MGKFRIASPQDFAGGLFLIAIGLGAYWASSNLGMGTLRAMGPGMLPKSLAVIVAGLGALLLLTSFRVEGPELERWSIRGLFFVLLGSCLFALTIRGSDITGTPERVASAMLIASVIFLAALFAATRMGIATDGHAVRAGMLAAYAAAVFVIYHVAPVIDLSFPAIGLIAAGPLVAIVSAFASPETKWGEVIIFATFMTALCAGLFKYALGLPIPLAPWLLGY
ncbi:MAG: hypothetical protein NTZ14_13530 [Hyphomicrobiales bacterium]|nr:hypothetical protein [Hyphomicrobiales bacterium]